MKRECLLLRLLLPLVFALALPATAWAQQDTRHGRAVALGEALFDAGPLPSELSLMTALTPPGEHPLRAGYRCQAVAVLWTWLARWDCTPVIYAGEQYYEDPAVSAVVARAYPDTDAIALDWWPRYGRWILLGALVVAVVLVSRLRSRPEPRTTSGSRNDPAHEPSAADDEPLDAP